MTDLKERAVRGGVARISAQIINFLFRLGSLVVLARLLDPKDFGLVGMVTAFTGVLGLFRDFGLSSAAVQRSEVTNAQASTLFWVNVFAGVVLGLITVAAAPVIAAFYAEPRLREVTIALASAFVINAAGVQHGVMLQRELRFTRLAALNTASLVVSTGLAIAAALAGLRYWSLVILAITSPLVNTVGSWVVAAWIPGRPQRQVGIREMARFGGTITINGLVYYAACNFDKVLIGRVLGVEALGLYGRAFQLISIPYDNLNSAAGELALSTLSRVHREPARLRSYFLKGYSLLLSLTIPVTVACAAFSDDVVAVVLGPKWEASAPIFRLLAPAMLGFAIVNPIGWLPTSLGLVGRGLKMALVISPFLVGAFIVGLQWGPAGVAAAYSIVMVLWMLPALGWAVQGTPVAFREIVLALSRPLFASALGAAAGLGLRLIFDEVLTSLSRLILESAVFALVYAATFLFALGQKSLYTELFRTSRNALAGEATFADAQPAHSKGPQLQ